MKSYQRFRGASPTAWWTSRSDCVVAARGGGPWEAIGVDAIIDRAHDSPFGRRFVTGL